MAPATLYEHSDIPPGMTCAEYRRALARPQKPGRLAKLRALIRAAALPRRRRLRKSS